MESHRHAAAATCVVSTTHMEEIDKNMKRYDSSLIVAPLNRQMLAQLGTHKFRKQFTLPFVAPFQSKGRE